MNDRLIINGDGEMVRAMAVENGKVRVQVTGFARLVTYDDTATCATVEVELDRKDAAVFALQVLDAAAYSAAIEPVIPHAARDEAARKGEDVPAELRAVYPADMAPMGRTMPVRHVQSPDATARNNAPRTVRKVVPSRGRDLFKKGE